jgi:hypothetical protein
MKDQYHHHSFVSNNVTDQRGCYKGMTGSVATGTGTLPRSGTISMHSSMQWNLIIGEKTANETASGELDYCFNTAYDANEDGGESSDSDSDSGGE